MTFDVLCAQCCFWLGDQTCSLDKEHIHPNSVIQCLCREVENNLLHACEYFYLRIGSLAEDLAYRSGSWCHWLHVSAAKLRRWPGSCYCTTMWWADGGEDACCVQTPLDGSDPCLRKESKHFFFSIAQTLRQTCFLLYQDLLFLFEFLSSWLHFYLCISV